MSGAARECCGLAFFSFERSTVFRQVAKSHRDSSASHVM
jgi:hypothetical protein